MNPVDPESVICDVCRRPLDHVVFPGYMGQVGTYRHTTHDLKDEDHAPVPIPALQMAQETILRCDFCCADNPSRLLRVHSFQLGPDSGSVGDWLACNEDAELIDAGRWDALARRAAKHQIEHDAQGISEQLVYQSLCRLYAIVRKNAYTGKTVPIEP